MSIFNIIDNRDKFKKLLKKDPTIIKKKYNKKSLIFYLILKNNIKMLENIFKINKNAFLEKDEKNLMYPHIALQLNLYDIFFNLCDKISIIDDKFFNYEIKNNYKLLDLLIEKNDINLLNSFIDKYNNYIEWYDNDYSYLLKLVIRFIEKLDEIIILIKKIIKKNNFNFEKFFKYPENNNAAFIVIYYYLKPEVYNIKNKIKGETVKEFIMLYPDQINFENKKFTPLFYYVGEYNDLDLLKFCYNNNANFNHFTKLGYNNFCHHIMLNSNNEIIKYILELDINFNFLNNLNETPIYSLLNNKNNISIDLIKKLLLKTDNWNNQNIYGFTIIHILCSKNNIENFYDKLKTKYIDINIKNIFEQSILDILYETYDKKLKYTNVNQKILDFKQNIILKNFINKLVKESDDIKDLCYNKFNNSCIEKALKLISSYNYTSPFKSDVLLNNIIILNYPFANINLFYGRDIDIYIYIKILLDSNEKLGIPKNLSFNLNKAKKLIENIENNFCLNLLDKTFKYSNLYPVNIYLLNEQILLPYNFDESIINSIQNYNKIYIIVRINIIDEVNHENILLIDSENKRIIRFEPQGGVNFKITNDLDNYLINYFINIIFFKEYKYFKPEDYLPINGLQSLSHEIDSDYVRKGDINGFCVAWSLWFVEFYITHSFLLKEDNNFKKIIFKFIKKIIYKGILIINYIRNYANYLHNKMIEILSEQINYHNLFYENYFDEDLIKLYNFINKEFN